MSTPNKKAAYQCALGQAQLEHLFMCDCGGIMVRKSSIEDFGITRHKATLACGKCGAGCEIVYWDPNAE